MILAISLILTLSQAFSLGNYELNNGNNDFKLTAVKFNNNIQNIRIYNFTLSHDSIVLAATFNNLAPVDIAIKVLDTKGKAQTSARIMKKGNAARISGLDNVLLPKGAIIIITINGLKNDHGVNNNNYVNASFIIRTMDKNNINARRHLEMNYYPVAVMCNTFQKYYQGLKSLARSCKDARHDTKDKPLDWIHKLFY